MCAHTHTHTHTHRAILSLHGLDFFFSFAVEIVLHSKEMGLYN